MVVQEVTKEVAEQMLNGWTNWRLKTFLTDLINGRTFFQSYNDAKEGIKREAEGKVDEVDC